jgi:Na+-transporting methylmalonyl-CoA/oxaloacetate decarboxylase gamma subunit
VLVILGKILLGILLFFLGLLLLILFIPIPYRLEGQLSEADKTLSDFKNLRYRIRIFGICVLSSDVKQRKKHKQAKIKNQEKKPSKKRKKNVKSSQKQILAIIPVVIAQLKDEENKAIVHLLIGQMKYLCRHYGPRKGKCALYYNLTDPSYTGLVTGLVSCFPIAYKKGVYICPDFVSEEGFIYGKLRIRGHVRTVHTVVCAFHLLKNRQIRQLLKARR